MTPPLTTTIGLVALVDNSRHLIGSRCGTCEAHAFPVQPTCQRCGESMAETPLPSGGKLWSWTVQRLRPKPPYEGPDEFEPFAVGYVDLGPLMVEARLVTHPGEAVDAWEIGQTVELVTGDPNADGEVWSFSFRKVSQ